MYKKNAVEYRFCVGSEHAKTNSLSKSFVFPRPWLLYCSLTVTQHPQDLLGGIAPHAEPHISGRLQLLRAPRGRWLYDPQHQQKILFNYPSRTSCQSRPPPHLIASVDGINRAMRSALHIHVNINKPSDRHPWGQS